MSKSILDVFSIIEIQWNRFQRVVMHVSIKRRNVVRWKNTPAGRRNKRRQSQVTIFLQISELSLRTFAANHLPLSMLESSLWWSPLLMHSLTRSTSSSVFPLNFKPLPFSHHFRSSTVYSSVSLSNLEPRMPSFSMRTVEYWSELLAIHVFSHATLTEFVCLSHGGSKKCRDVISAKRY